MRRRLRHRRSRPGSAPSLRKRIVGFVRTLFSSGQSLDDWGDGLTGGLGVREPRRPIHPTLAGSATLDLPPFDSRDVWAIADDRD